MVETEEPIEEIYAEDDLFNEFNEKRVELTILDQIGLFCYGGLDIVTGYGWYIAAGVVLFFYLYQKYKSSLERLNVFNRNGKEPSITQSPEEILVKQEAMELARRKMQEKLNKLLEEERIKTKEKEEQKRKEKIDEWEKFQSGGRFRSKNKLGTEPDDANAASGSTPKKQDKDGNKRDKSLRGEFNPLTGSGFGSSYRPNRRGMSGGGG